MLGVRLRQVMTWRSQHVLMSDSGTVNLSVIRVRPPTHLSAGSELDPPIRLCAMTQGGLQHDEAFEYEDCKAHCRLIAVTWVVFIQLTESAS